MDSPRAANDATLACSFAATATHCGLRLHECDAHLGYVRLGIAEQDLAAARDHLEKARTIIDETGYHRRDAEMRDLDAALAAHT